MTLLMAFLVACSTSGGSVGRGVPTTDLPTPPTSTTATTLPLPSGTSLEDLEDILPPKPQFREFTRDDPPTFAEYEEAVFATAACLEALGLEVRGPALSSDPDLLAKTLVEGISVSETYNILVADPKPGTKPLMSVDQALDFCYEWSGENSITLLRFSPSEEQIRAWYEQFRSCLKAAGFEGVDELTDEELSDGAFGPYFECTP
ncbi:MAG: hypothetical protein ACE5F5_07650 [Acidimicrobiia bacterium]